MLKIFSIRTFLFASVIFIGVGSFVRLAPFSSSVSTPVSPVVSSGEETRPLVSDPAMPDVKSEPLTDSSLSSASAPQPSQGTTKTAPVSVAKPVVKNTQAAATGIADPVCKQGNIMEQYDCYGKFYTQLVKSSGAPAGMEHIKKKYALGDAFYISQCHQLTHMVGRAATEKYTTVSEAYTHGDSFCWSGYYHGVMEGIVSHMGGDVASKLDSICADLPGKAQYTFDYYNCVHGLGHGVMYILNNELPASLEMCDHLSGWWEQSSCHGGVFMENIIADEVNHKAKYLSNDDPHYPCSIVADKYKGTCYLMQTSRMLTLAGGDFAKVFKECDDAPQVHINTCYQSLGRDASGRSVSKVEQTKASCLLGHNPDALKYCFRGAVMDFVSYHHSDVQAKELCTAIPAELQEDCFSTAVDYYKRF